METKPLNIKGADTAFRVQKLLKNLIECMSQETLALHAQNQTIAGTMSKEKIRLFATYKAIAAELQNNPDILKTIDKDIQKQLITLMDDFDQTLKENITAIQTGRFAVSRLINRLLTKAREAVGHPNRNYNEKGKLVEQKIQSATFPTQLNEVY